MGFIPPSVVAINRRRRRAGTMSKDDLKKVTLILPLFAKILWKVIVALTSIS